MTVADDNVILVRGDDANGRRRNRLEVYGRAWAAENGVPVPRVIDHDPGGAWMVTERVHSLPQRGSDYVDAAMESADRIASGTTPNPIEPATTWRHPNRWRTPVRALQLAAAGISPMLFVGARRASAAVPSVVPSHFDYHPGNVLFTAEAVAGTAEAGAAGTAGTGAAGASGSGDATVTEAGATGTAGSEAGGVTSSDGGQAPTSGGAATIIDFEYLRMGPRYADAIRLFTTLELHEDAAYGVDWLLRRTTRGEWPDISAQLRWLALRPLAELITVENGPSQPLLLRARERWNLAQGWVEEIDRGFRQPLRPPAIPPVGGSLPPPSPVPEMNEARRQVETPQVETPRVETPRVETPRVETPQVETPQGKAAAPGDATAETA